MKSVITDETDRCFICGDYATQEHHLIFGTSGRKFAEKYGLKVPICANCHTMNYSVNARIHDNVMAEILSKRFGQAIFEREMIRQGMTLKDARQKMILENGKIYY